jgi:glycosyltransferase involved in cell wall biosynthesis
MRGLRTAGYEVTCAQSRASHHLIDEQKNLGIRHLWLGEDNIYDFSTIPRAMTNRPEAQKIFSRAQPDLIIFSDGCPFSSFAAKELAGRLTIPYMAIEHCVAEEWAVPFASYLPRLAAIFHQARAVIAVCHENLRLLRKVFRLPKNQGRVIYCGRPLEYFVPPDPAVCSRVRQELSIPENAVMALTVARLGIVKGYQYQLKAMHQLKESESWRHLYFVWVGGGSYESRIRAVAMELGVAERIKLLGERADIPDLLDAADMFILPSQFEGMPLSVMEAMAKGVPVMATAVSGISEELGSTGKLVPNPRVDEGATIEEMVRTIEAWAANPGARSEVGGACKRRAEEMFRADRMVAVHLEIIRSILGTP